MANVNREKTHLGLMQEYHVQSYPLDVPLPASVTHIIDAKNFYIRLTVFDCYLGLLKKRAKKVHVDDIATDKKYILKFNTIDNFARGIIKSVDYRNNMVSALAIDYGFEEGNIPFQSVFKAKEIIDIPGLAKLCELADFMPPPNPIKNITAAMRYYLGDNEVGIILRSPTSLSKLRVSVLLKNRLDLATTLNQLLAEPVKQKNKSSAKDTKKSEKRGKGGKHKKSTTTAP